MLDLWLEDPERCACTRARCRCAGTGAISRSWALIMANTPYIQFFLTDVEVSVRGDIASVTCTENMLTGDEAPGRTCSAARGRWPPTCSCAPTEGWRLWIHHASPVLSSGDTS